MNAGTDNRFSLGLRVVISLLVLIGGCASAARAGVPADPVPFDKGNPLLINGGENGYWTYVPNSYDASHSTPIKLLVWLHGCGGYSSGDIWTASPGGSAQSWITIAPGGREGGCWNPGTDQSKVLTAVDDVATHFNINPRQVILGGYSSGGDLAYRTAFYHASHFAGVLAENTAPFSDTGSSQADSLAAAAWKFNVVHLAHNQDNTYPVGEVESQINAMVTAGFPAQLIKVDGNHYDNPNVVVNGHAVPGTTADLRSLLLPHMNDGWLSPDTTPIPDPDPVPDPDPFPDPDPDPGPAPVPDPDPDPAPDPQTASDPPPKVTIKSKPKGVTRSRKAAFRFSSSINGSTFECRIDGKPFSRCTSPQRYKDLETIRHRFAVKAISEGTIGPVVKYSWKVLQR